ncbi:uncharacterized protein EURHEDRAFT_413510 [Aspergillus ruber CBS 135680]|uniref:Uncharacterized protein n=1 Tax=Aspergillus ruber (strain CBS 135680) TaxID=1388766 RepID=A0A017SB67_ASPRC|nr:uncharacterized protein EURHEDRAFT_413510 [Aspergillus ruber CBS 135680]EYE94288.1 hypothetical protein EURHEDRAFT_413510 [Aspergillus ruber CBS 135680]
MSRPPEPGPDVIEVSRWSTSSSEEEEDENVEGHGVGSHGSKTSQNKNAYAHDKNATKRDDHPQNEQEVIYELDEDAMSQLPDHLQTNMREIQQERMERIHRENSHVQIRKVSTQKEARGDNWFKNMLYRFPSMPNVGFHANRDNVRRKNSPGLDDLEAHERARLAPDSPLPLTKDNLEYLTECTGGETNVMLAAATRRRRVEKKVSIKDRIYSRLSGKRRREEEAALRHLKNIESQVHVGIPQCYKNLVEEEEEKDRQASARALGEGKPSLRGRVKKSMQKMSMAFKKG